MINVMANEESKIYIKKNAKKSNDNDNLNENN